MRLGATINLYVYSESTERGQTKKEGKKKERINKKIKKEDYNMCDQTKDEKTILLRTNIHAGEEEIKKD